MAARKPREIPPPEITTDSTEHELGLADIEFVDPKDEARRKAKVQMEVPTPPATLAKVVDIHGTTETLRKKAKQRREKTEAATERVEKTLADADEVFAKLALPKHREEEIAEKIRKDAPTRRMKQKSPSNEVAASFVELQRIEDERLATEEERNALGITLPEPSVEAMGTPKKDRIRLPEGDQVDVFRTPITAEERRQQAIFDESDRAFLETKMAGSPDRVLLSDALHVLFLKEADLQQRIAQAKGTTKTRLNKELSELQQRVAILEEQMLPAKKTPDAIAQKIQELYPNLKGKDYARELSPAELREVQRDALKSLITDMEARGEAEAQPQQLHAYEEMLASLEKDKRKYVTGRIKEAADATADALHEKHMEAAAEQFFATPPVAPATEEKKLPTEPQYRDIYDQRRELEELLATLEKNQQGESVKADEARKKLVAVKAQIAEGERVLSQRTVGLETSGAAPSLMREARDSASATVSRSRRARAIEEDRKAAAARAKSPFAAVETSLMGAITDPLLRKDSYLPGVLRQQRDALEKEKAMGGPQAKDAERVIAKIDSALANVDFHRLSEAVNAIETRYKEAADKTNASEEGTPEHDLWQHQRSAYEGMLKEASRDVIDVYAKEIEERFTDLQERYGISVADVNALRQGKVKFFSKPLLWFKKQRMQRELQQLNAIVAQKEEATRRLNA